jgi:CheY-like chemotaxis protein
VDDKELNRLVLKEMLEAAGFGTIEAENGKVAVERARELMPRIVFMDIKMPVMDGYQAVKALKDDPATNGIKVFALTASAFINDERKILASGFDGFLAKPFKRSDLFRLIRDKSGIELEYERAPESGHEAEVPAIEDIDFAQARDAMGPDAVAELSDAVQINDFSLVRSIVGRLEGAGSGGARIPEGLAALAKRAAGAFDDDCLSRIVSELREAGQ